MSFENLRDRSTDSTASICLNKNKTDLGGTAMIVLELCATISVWFAQRFGEAIVAVILAKLLEWWWQRDRVPLAPKRAESPSPAPFPDRLVFFPNLDRCLTAEPRSTRMGTWLKN